MRRGVGILAMIWASAVGLVASAAEPVVAKLEVVDESGKATKFDAAALEKLPRRAATVKDRDGVEHKWEGPHVGDVLQAAGVALGNELRGPRLTLFLVAEAADGYRVVFTLSELDPTNTDAAILLADRCDGEPLDERSGPLRIVVPHEKRHARWIRQVQRLVIAKAPPGSK